MSKLFNPVLFFVPNVLCYVRIILLLIGINFIFSNVMITYGCFASSLLLDGMDGHCARWLKQESNFGKALDFTLDRATLLIMSAALILIYPHYWICFLAVMLLDNVSHFYQLYATVFSRSTSHKALTIKKNSLLYYYYTNRFLLFTTCFIHDFWLSLLYLHHFYSNKIIVGFIIFFSPGFLLKSWVHILQIINAIKISLKQD